MGTHNEIHGGTFLGTTVVQAEHATVLPSVPQPRALGGLPARSPVLVGRDAELADLTDRLTDPRPTGRLITGLPGAGKTELALHAVQGALDVPGRYPGGVLFLDLFGYDEDRRVGPDRALGSLLRALGVPDDRMPADTEERARLYRTVLAEHAAGRPLVVLLDNAGSSAQVRPLLPGDPRVPVLVTSRHTLGDLRLRVLDLPVLSAVDGVALLGQGLHELNPDDRRIAEQPDAAREITDLCGGLPLALAVVTALLGELPSRPLAAMAQSLRDTRRRLARLASEDLAVRAAFRLSLRHLPADQARLFRLLSLHPGPDVATGTAARLADLPAEDAEPLLHALARAHLVQPAGHDRWQLHDLLRLYADEQCREKEKPAQREAATRRLLEHYLRRTVAADTHLTPGALPHPQFADRAAALAWLDAEHPNLRAAALAAPDLGMPRLQVVLHGHLTGYLTLRRHFTAYTELAGAVVHTLRSGRLPRPPGAESAALNDLGNGLRELRRFDEAVAAYRGALGRTGDAGLRAGVMTNLGLTYRQMGRPAEAAEVLQEALALCPPDIAPLDRGRIHHNLGLALSSLRRDEEAEAAFRTDLEICRRLGDRQGEGVTLNCIGLALRDQRRYGEAADAFRAALAAARATDDRYTRATAEANLDLVTALGDGFDFSDAAVARVTAATDALEAMGDAHTAAQVKADFGTLLLGAGRVTEAVAVLTAALDAGRALDARRTQALALANLAVAREQSGDLARALDEHTEAVRLFRLVGDRLFEAQALFGLGAARHAAGEAERAVEALTAAAEAFRELGVPDRAEESRRLAADAAAAPGRPPADEAP